MGRVCFIGYVETKDENLLKSAAAVKNAVIRLCEAVELKIVGEKYHIFNEPNGITYCFILSQSHFVVHTWPEEHRIFFDVFMCNKELDKEYFIAILSKEFQGTLKEIDKVEYK